MKPDIGSPFVEVPELLALMRPYVRLSPSNWRMGWAQLLDVEDPEEAKKLDDRLSRLADAEIELIGDDRLRLAFDTFDKLADAETR